MAIGLEHQEEPWPISVMVGTPCFYSDRGGILVHQNGMVGGRKCEHLPSADEKVKLLAAVAEQKALCEQKLKELALVEALLKQG